MGLFANHFEVFAIFIFKILYIFIFNLIFLHKKHFLIYLIIKIYTSIQITMILILKPRHVSQNFKTTHHFSIHQAERGSWDQHPWISA